MIIITAINENKQFGVTLYLTTCSWTRRWRMSIYGWDKLHFLVFIHSFIVLFTFYWVSFLWMRQKWEREMLWHEEKWNKKQLQTQIDELGKLLLLFFSSIIFSFSSFLFPIFVFLLIYFHFSLPFFTLSIKRWGRVRKKMLLNCTNPLQLLVYSYIKVHLTPILFSSCFLFISHLFSYSHHLHKLILLLYLCA